MPSRKKPRRPERVLAAFEAPEVGPGGELSWHAARDALVAAIDAAGDVDEVEALLLVEPISDIMFGEAVPWPEVADAIVRRAAREKEAADGARLLGWAIRACALYPAKLLRADLSSRLQDEERSTYAEGFARHLSLFRSWFEDPSPERRVAGAHAVAWCATAGPDDARAVLAAVAKEKSAPALATDLVTLGVVLHRRGEKGDLALQTRELAAKRLGHKNGLVRVCAAAALALLGQRLDAAAVGALAGALAKPAALPPEWGWRSLQPPAMKSDELACAVLCWAELDAREPALEGLLAMRIEKQTLGVVLMAGDALAHVAFGPRDRRPIAAAELDGLGRRLLTEIAAGKQPRAAGRVLAAAGLPSFQPERNIDNVKGFLAQHDLDWRPIAVQAGERERRWHFARIRAAALAGEVDVAGAREAIARACSPEERVLLAARLSDARPHGVARLEAPEHLERDQALGLALLESARADGFAFAPVYGAALAEPFWWRTHLLAIVLLREHGPEVAEEYAPIAASGVSAAPCAEPLRSLLAAAPAAFRRAALRTAAIGAGSWSFWDLGLDDPAVVRKLVLHGQNYAWKEDRPRVVETLARGGEEIGPLLRAIEYSTPEVRRGGEAVVADVVATIRGRSEGPSEDTNPQPTPGSARAGRGTTATSSTTDRTPPAR